MAALDHDAIDPPKHGDGLIFFAVMVVVFALIATTSHLQSQVNQLKQQVTQLQKAR